MINITLHDGKGKLEIKLSKGKKFTINKDNFKTWKKAEVMEV